MVVVTVAGDGGARDGDFRVMAAEPVAAAVTVVVIWARRLATSQRRPRHRELVAFAQSRATR